MIEAMLTWLRQHFSNLESGSYAITSTWSEEYNCIAWAAGDTEKWWWPIDSPDAYWPRSLPYEVSVENFIKAFAHLGYHRFADGSHEHGFEKVVIYVGPDGKPNHMARQLGATWSSKLGSGYDIVHEDLGGVECPDYGEARYFLRREKSQ